MRHLLLAMLLGACGGAAASAPPATTAATSEEPPPGPPQRTGRRIAVGRGFGCAILATGPTCWGTPPLGVGVDPRTAAPLAGAVELSAPEDALCARYDDGSVRCFESAFSYRAGAGSGAEYAPPLPAPALRIVGGCALTTVGEVWCWDARWRRSWTDRESLRRLASLPGAVDFAPDGLAFLEASGRVSLGVEPPADTAVTIEGARALVDAGNQQVFVLGTSAHRVRVVGALQVEDAGAVLDAAAAAGEICIIDDPSHAHCRRFEDQDSTIEISGIDGMEQIAVFRAIEPVVVTKSGKDGMDEPEAGPRACVLTSADEVYCVSLEQPREIIELASASTGLVEQGGTVCATSDEAWRCLRRGENVMVSGVSEHLFTWSSRAPECTGVEWFDYPVGGPIPESAGWMLCGTELRVGLSRRDDGDTVRPLRIGRVSGVHRATYGLALQMTDGSVRPLELASYPDRGRLGPVLTGFEHVSDVGDYDGHCAITGAGAVRCPSSGPAGFVDVAGITDPVEVETEPRCGCARTTAGTVLCFGFDAGGPSAPRDVGLAGVTRLVSGLGRLCALSSDGRVVCAIHRIGWTPDDHCDVWSPPVLDDVTEIESGYGFMCARRTSGRVLCWGNIEEGTRATDVEASVAPDRTPIRVAP